MDTRTNVRCRYVTGFTRLPSNLGPLSRHEREDKIGKALGDGRYEWLCGYRADWIVEGPEGSLAACSRDVHAVAVQLGQGEPVTLTPVKITSEASQ